MIRQFLLATVILTFAATIAPDARAALCFHYQNSDGGVSVAQVDLPKPNTCETFATYEVGTNPATTLLGAGTGSLCMSADSPMLIYHYTYQGCLPFGGTDNYWESATCRLQLDHNGNLPTQFSVCRGSLITGKPTLGKASTFFNQDDLVITKCDSNDIHFRVPGGTVSECGRGRLRLGEPDMTGRAGKAPREED